jgi:hypothetical protein
MMPFFYITAWREGERLTATRATAKQAFDLSNDLLSQRYTDVEVKGPGGEVFLEDDLPTLISEENSDRK